MEVTDIIVYSDDNTTKKQLEATNKGWFTALQSVDVLVR